MNKEVTIDIENPKDDDLISRQAVLDILARYEDFEDLAGVLIRVIKELPSVTPQPKTGWWKYDYMAADGHRVYHCSECGCYLKPKHSEPLNSFKWCSLCGTKMQAENEDKE